jgi:hypothetical protein
VPWPVVCSDCKLLCSRTTPHPFGMPIETIYINMSSNSLCPMLNKSHFKNDNEEKVTNCPHIQHHVRMLQPPQPLRKSLWHQHNRHNCR